MYAERKGKWTYQYYLTDHLGNTRVLFADQNDDGTVDATEILQQNHYYPFGMEMDGGWNQDAAVEQRYRYNGIEHSEELGLDLAPFRSYDPAIGRWLQVDPIIKFHESGYAGMANNPIRFADPMGLDTITPTPGDFSPAPDLPNTLPTATVTPGSRIGPHRYNHQGREQSPEGALTELLDNVARFRDDRPLGINIPYPSEWGMPSATSLSWGFAFGGGFGFEIGRVSDGRGGKSWFFRSDARIGFGGGFSINQTDINPTPGAGLFVLQDFQGYDNSWGVGMGPYSVGGGENQRVWGKKGDGLFEEATISGDLYSVGTRGGWGSFYSAEELKTLHVRAKPSLFFGAYRSWGLTKLF